MNYLLGIDAGTTSMKGMLIDENGKVICLADESYTLTMQNKFEIEIDACSYWEALKMVVKIILNRTEISTEKIRAISVDSQGETLICLDKNGEPLRKAIVWLDNRSFKEAEEIRRDFGAEGVFNITGQPEVVATWPATKILWIRKNEKSIFERTDKYLLVADYINFKLSGKYVTDKSMMSSSLYYDIVKSKWWEDMLDYIGISGNQLPCVKSSGTWIGNLTEKASTETGLSPDTMVITGAMDQMAGAAGAGNITPEIVSESTGTCLAVCVNINNPIPYSDNFKIPCHCNVLEDNGFSLLFWSQTAGIILEWFKDNFYIEDNFHAKENFCAVDNEYNKYTCNKIYKRIDDESAKINPGSDGLIVLPYFCGSAVPHFNPEARGVFFGVNLKHTKAHFSRAIMEAVGFMLREHIETAESFGTVVKEIRSLGGGANSYLWNQIKADITRREIVTLENPETASLGAAMLAGVGSGVFNDYLEACGKCVKVKERYYPNTENAPIYETAYQKYRSIYQSVNHLY